MINLFYLQTCPYCTKVINFLKENNMEYSLLDINETENLEKLMIVGGKRQVPFLIDTENNIDMYESNDIIEYLKTLL